MSKKKKRKKDRADCLRSFNLGSDEDNPIRIAVFQEDGNGRVVVCVPDGDKYRVLVSIEADCRDVSAVVHTAVGRPKKLLLIEGKKVEK